MKFVAFSTVIASLALPALGNPLEKRAAGTATVTLSAPRGAPTHLVSGLLYGVPDQANQVPDDFYSAIGFNFLRAGGSQLPQKGWCAGGEAAYRPRFESALANYRTARKYGAKYMLLVADLWGADSTQAGDAPFPGDNGDWSNFDRFLDTLTNDIKTNGMQTGLYIDIWNEPDNYPFWSRNQDQYLALWSRAYAKYRSALGTGVKLTGPSSLGQPRPDNDWWNNFMSYISKNNVIPDQYSWHLLLNADDEFVDPEYSTQVFNTQRAKYNLPARSINLNEFALREEQQPAASVWYLSRFERLNVTGMRANYGFGYELHDYFAGLLGKPNAGTDQYDATAGGYWANGEWQLLKYYNQKMTGKRVATTGSGDKKFDVYATVNNNSFKVIAGSRLRTGTWVVEIRGLSALGKAKSGSVKVRVLRFGFAGYYGQVGDPVVESQKQYNYSNDILRIPVTPADENTAYSFELV